MCPTFSPEGFLWSEISWFYQCEDSMCGILTFERMISEFKQSKLPTDGSFYYQFSSALWLSKTFFLYVGATLFQNHMNSFKMTNSWPDNTEFRKNTVIFFLWFYFAVILFLVWDLFIFFLIWNILRGTLTQLVYALTIGKHYYVISFYSLRKKINQGQVSLSLYSKLRDMRRF